MYRYELESWKVLGWCEEVPAPLWKLCCSLPVKNAWMKNHHQLRHTSSVTSENSEWGYAQKTWLPNLQCQKCTIFHLMSDSSQQSDLKTCYYRVKRTSHHLRKSNSTIGEGNGTPLQYCCLENPMDGGAWKAEVHGVAEGQTQLSDFFHFSLSCVGEGNGNPLQCACLENLRHGGAWWAAIYGVAQSQTRLKWLSSSSSNSTISM